MHQDLINIIFLYVDIDEYYELKDDYKLCVKFYCKNVDRIQVTAKNYVKWGAFLRDVVLNNKFKNKHNVFWK